MAQQGTEEQTSSDQPSSEEASGKHRAHDEGATDQQGSTEKDTGGTESSSSSSEKSTSSETSSSSEKSTSSETSSSSGKSTSSDARTEKQPPADAPTEKHERGAADTSWAEPENPQRRHVDVGEIAWRAGNVVATVLRTLALLFALVLIVNVVLVLVGVNPANGVAQFIGGLANLVILGFRDLFVPADPTIALIVNSLVAAVFWVFVGELVSRLIRFLAARVK